VVGTTGLLSLGIIVALVPPGIREYRRFVVSGKVDGLTADGTWETAFTELLRLDVGFTPALKTFEGDERPAPDELWEFLKLASRGREDSVPFDGSRTVGSAVRLICYLRDKAQQR
jgi:hypothetical protein